MGEEELLSGRRTKEKKKESREKDTKDGEEKELLSGLRTKLDATNKLSLDGCLTFG